MAGENRCEDGSVTGKGVKWCIRRECDIKPTSTKEWEPGSLGWVEKMHMAEVPYRSNVVANTLFGKKDRRLVVLNTSLEEK